MEWKRIVSNQIMVCYDLCLFIKISLSYSWMALFAILLLFSGRFGFSSFLFTSLLVIFSTFLYVVSKNKSINIEEKLVVEEEEESFSDQCEEQEQEQEQEESREDNLSNCEGSEEDWRLRLKYENDDYYSKDGSISDEESLIEIALPSGNYVDVKKERWIELLTEFNEVMIEEENLIEIDISMGSIKYSRFEIKA
ncbi:unnamed protein product [Lathyrus sativus]|nr:unnamed protein product [Lathyrus sativus]